jgi:hypothetical protein
MAHRVRTIVTIIGFTLFGFAVFPSRSPAADTGPWKQLKPIEIKALAVGKAKKIATLKETKDLHPVSLCWSPDDSQLFIYAERVVVPKGGAADVAVRKGYFLLSSTGADLQETEAQPPWAGPYWDYKSSLTSPEGTKLEKGGSERVESVYRMSGKIVERPWFPFRKASEQAQQNAETSGLPSRVSEMRSRDPGPSLFYPGMTYSWSPPGGRTIAYYDDFKVSLLSEDGKTSRKIASGDLYLPAWSHDGTRIAFVRIPESHIWEIHVVELSGIQYEGENPQAGAQKSAEEGEKK